MSLQGAQKLTEGIRMTGGMPWLPGMLRGAGRSIMEGSCVCDTNCQKVGRDLWDTDSRVKFLSCEPLIGPLPELNLDRIDWLIVGGESGHKPRPMQPEWVSAIKEQCRLTCTSFFFKQWGGRNKKKAGRVFEGRTWDEMPGVETKIET